MKLYLLNYNYYYIDLIKKRQKGWWTNQVYRGFNDYTSASANVQKAVELFSQHTNPNMDHYICEEVLDWLY